MVSDGQKTLWYAYAQAVGVVALTTALAWLMFPHFELANLIMVYLLGVVMVAARSGRGPSILASVLSVATFDFFFVPPYLTFQVADGQYVVTFAVSSSLPSLRARSPSGFVSRWRRRASASGGRPLSTP